MEVYYNISLHLVRFLNRFLLQDGRLLQCTKNACCTPIYACMKSIFCSTFCLIFRNIFTKISLKFFNKFSNLYLSTLNKNYVKRFQEFCTKIYRTLAKYPYGNVGLLWCWMLPKIPIVLKNTSNKNCITFNCLQKTQRVHVFISPRSGGWGH